MTDFMIINIYFSVVATDYIYIYIYIYIKKVNGCLRPTKNATASGGSKIHSPSLTAWN